MTDFADLGIRVQSTDVVRARGELVQLTRTGADTERQVERQTTRISAAWSRMGMAARTAAGLIASALGARAIFRSAEQYTQMTNALRTLGLDASQAATRLREISSMAAATRAPLESTVGLYQRVSIAATELGASGDDIMRFTRNVGLALAQQGGSAASAAGALTQLSQALAGGTVRAEEFNSILEGAFPIAQAAARGIDAAGGSVARLRQMVIAGEVSSAAFFQAVLSQSAALEEAFGRTVPTVGQAMGVLSNRSVIFIGRLDSMLGASRAVAGAIMAVAGAVSAMTGGLEAAATFFSDYQGYFISTAMAITGYFLPAISAAAMGIVRAYVPAIWGAVTATYTWVASLITLRGAMIATGIGAFVVAAGYVINSLIQLRERTGSWGAALGLLGDVARGVWSGIVTSAGAIPLGLSGVWLSVEAGFRSMVSSLSGLWAEFLGSMVSNLGGVSTPFGDVDFGAMLGLEDAIAAAERFSTLQTSRSNTAASNANIFYGAADDRATQGYDQARAALDALRAAMADTGGATTDTTAALAAINEALGETPAAAGAAAGGVGAVGVAAEEAQSRIERIAGSMSRFFLQIAQGGDAARQAISQLLSRAAEMLMNNALMSLLGGAGLGGGSIVGGLLGMLFNANGNVFSGSPSLSAYSGQVVSNPTMFAFANGGVPGGRMGVMGEAGPEAIMPLKRASDGKLGVAASGGQQSVVVEVVTRMDQNGNLQSYVERTTGRVVARQRPGIISDAVSATYTAAREVPLR